MSAGLLLCLVLLATLGLFSVLLSAVVAVVWHTGLSRKLVSSADMLTLRLLPFSGALLLVFAVVLPAFMAYEPAGEREATGPILLTLAALACTMLGHGIWRAWRASVAARELLDQWRSDGHSALDHAPHVEVLDVTEPIVAVVGGWRPRIIAGRSVVAACSEEEFTQVIAHEAAHIRSHDNFKLLLLTASPDPLAWIPLGATLVERWRAAAEREADEHATGADPRRRVALASALIKVARLGVDTGGCPALSMRVGADDVETRVRRLLEAPQTSPAAMASRVVLCALLIPFLGAPLYEMVHELVEALVRLGA